MPRTVLKVTVLCAALAAVSPGLKARGSITQFQAIERSLPPLPSGSGTIVGVVLTDTGEPAVGATVSLKQPEEPPDFEPPAYRARSTTTDALGRFTFTSVPANTVELSATLPGFLEAVYGQARPGLRGTLIRLHADEQLPVELRLSRGSIIAGMVLDSGGASAAGISVFAFRMRPSSDAESWMGSGGEATTNQRGEYRIADLPPGKYLVSAYRVWSSSDGRPPVQQIGPNTWAIESGAFFPDTVDANSAEQIAIDAGQDRTGINLRLRMSPITTITGVVRGADGQPVANASVRLMKAGEPVPPLSQATTGPDGAFELTRVGAGKFDIVAFSPSAAPDWGRLLVTSDGRMSQRVGIDLRPGATVSGRVVFAGRALTAPTAPIRLFFAAVHGVAWHDVPGLGHATASPEFTYRGVPPGRYVIDISGFSLPAGWRMQSEMVDGRDALDFPFEINVAEHREVVITLSDETTEVSGRVTDAIGAPVADRMVVVFAADDRFWTPRSRRVQIVRPDTYGHYRVGGLPAGEYVVGIAGADLDGAAPTSLLRDLRAVSPVITLGVGEKKTFDVRSGG